MHLFPECDRLLIVLFTWMTGMPVEDTASCILAAHPSTCTIISSYRAYADLSIVL
ncbi:hypothetical protein [Chitinophaga sp.]|uniref:hypothetical protein n=1 Tax=Chitinophaga sp. TaxID=1869181 RepID=UPI0031DB53FB